jgi:hypothetical protein
MDAGSDQNSQAKGIGQISLPVLERLKTERN